MEEQKEVEEIDAKTNEEADKDSFNKSPDSNVESATTYTNEMNKIMKSLNSADEKLSLIDLVIKDYLRKKFRIKKTLEYSEMIEFFLEKNKPLIATFCHEMLQSLYSGEKIDAGKLEVVIEDFKNILIKEENEKESSIKEPSLKNVVDPIINVFHIFKHKKNSPSIINTNYVSKQVKNEINNTLIEPKKAEEEKTVKKKTEKNKVKLNPMLYKLNPAERPGFSIANSENADYDYIENIDDLERIKQKIKQRRATVYAKAST